MVDSGMYGVKPYVTTDCGGDYFPTGGDLIRWMAFCTFGTILRLHGADHRPWIYEKLHLNWVKPGVVAYIRLRYRMSPSLIAYGHQLKWTGKPYVARCDFYWPGKPEAQSNHQYIFLDDVLVSPQWQNDKNMSAKKTWIPPGLWQDMWDGSIVKGPQM